MMKRSKPSTVVGGGEMKRDTSSVVSIANSEAASSRRSSRSVKPVPVSTGRPDFQSLVVTVVLVAVVVALTMVVVRVSSGWKGIFSMTRALLQPSWSW
jgi:hypothetical protein